MLIFMLTNQRKFSSFKTEILWALTSEAIEQKCYEKVFFFFFNFRKFLGKYPWYRPVLVKLQGIMLLPGEFCEISGSIIL